MELFDQLAIKELEIVFLEILNAAEKGVFRNGKAFWRVHEEGCVRELDA